MKISSVFSLIHNVELKIAWFYRDVASCVMANPLKDKTTNFWIKVKVTKRVETVRARSNKKVEFKSHKTSLKRFKIQWCEI